MVFPQKHHTHWGSIHLGLTMTMIYQQLVVSMETFPLLRLPEAKDSPGFFFGPVEIRDEAINMSDSDSNWKRLVSCLAKLRKNPKEKNGNTRKITEIPSMQS